MAREVLKRKRIGGKTFYYRRSSTKKAVAQKLGDGLRGREGGLVRVIAYHPGTTHGIYDVYSTRRPKT